MSQFGPNTALVEEIIASVDSEIILHPIAPLRGDSVRIVTDFRDAKHLARSVPINDSDEAPTWTDLREHYVSELNAMVSRQRELEPIEAATDELFDRFTDTLERLVSARFPGILDDIGADLSHCARNRALRGLAPDSFFERLWQIYRQGYWPCGWEGEYPQGSLLVYQPPMMS